MKILHVGVGNLDSGGVATYVRSLLAGQRSRGHEVVLSELWPNAESMPGVQHFLPDQEALVELQDRIRPDVTHLHSQLPDYSLVRQPAVLTAHEHSAHCPSGGRFLHARRTACQRDFGLLPCLWGHYVDRCGSRNPRSFLRRFRLTSGSRRFEGHWVAPSSYTATWLRRSGMETGRIHVVGNPLPEPPPDRDPNPSPPPTVLFLGRLVANKGCDVLLRAAARLPPTTRIRVAGDGPERARLDALARELGLADQVEFLGWTSAEQVRSLLDDARVLAVPSLWPEPFGLVALEAYAAGRPVVASSVGGLADLVVDGVTGRLVPPDSPQDLAEALGTYLADPAGALRAGLAGREHAIREFSMGAHLDALDRVYVQAMEAKG